MNRSELAQQVAQKAGVDNSQALIGEKVRIRGLQFEVIGVLKSKGQASAFMNPDEQVLIPLQTARYRTFGTDRLVISGVLAPVYELGGDSFDYALNASGLEFAIIDAVGHGLPARDPVLLNGLIRASAIRSRRGSAARM